MKGSGTHGPGTGIGSESRRRLRYVTAAIAAAAVLAVAGCTGEDGNGATSAAKPRLPDRIGSAERIDAWDGLVPDNPPDTPSASDEAVDELGAARRLAEEMEYLGYTDTHDWQGAYYYDPHPAPGRSSRIIVIVAAGGDTPADEWIRRLRKETGDSTGSDSGGIYSCTNGTCLWADSAYLIHVLGDGRDDSAVRTLIRHLRTGEPA